MYHVFMGGQYFLPHLACHMISGYYQARTPGVLTAFDKLKSFTKSKTVLYFAQSSMPIQIATLTLHFHVVILPGSLRSSKFIHEEIVSSYPPQYGSHYESPTFRINTSTSFATTDRTVTARV